MSAAPLIDIVIVNYNAGPLLRRCLRSIEEVSESDAVSIRTVVIDNASTDDSLDRLDEDAKYVRIIRNEQNLGFAAACNKGSAAGSAPVLLFLNPDVVLLPGALRRPLGELEALDGRAILGVSLLTEEGELQRTCARFPTPGRLVAQSLGLSHLLPSVFKPHFMLDWDHKNSATVDQVMGAYLMMFRSLFDELSGFDERFFLYYEDVDLALRAAEMGIACRYVADARAIHRAGGSTQAVKARRLAYSLASRHAFLAKHYGLATAIAAALPALLVEPWLRAANALATGQPIGDVLRGYALWLSGHGTGKGA